MSKGTMACVGIFAGILAALGYLVTVPLNAAGETVYKTRDYLFAGIFFLQGMMHALPWLAGQGAAAGQALKVMICTGLLTALSATAGCAPTGTVSGHMNPDGTFTVDAGVSFKALRGQIEQAITCEKAALAAELNSFKKMTADEKASHDAYRAAHKKRLKILESGQWAPPVEGVPPVADAGADVPAPAPIAEVISDPVFSPATPSTGPPAKGVTWGVFFGKNKYPGAELAGCVNDVADIQTYCTLTHGLDAAHTIVLLDEHATTANEIAALTSTIAKVRPGDGFVFWDSGHGAEYPGADGKVHNVTCPIDFDWSEEHMLTDTQLKDILAKLPPGTLGNHGSDTCFSGGLDRAKLKPGDRPRTFPHMPDEVARKLDRLKLREAVSTREMINGAVNIGFISGCGAKQTSADTSDENGRPCGAMTHYFLKIVRAPGNADKPISDLVKQMNQALSADQYEQKPEAYGARKDRPFLKN